MNDYLHCPLCGFEFAKRDTPCEHGCPLGRFCNLVCCPNCRYEFPPQPHSLTWFARLFGHRAIVAHRRDVLALPDFDEGEHGELVCVNCEHNSLRNTLAVYGLVPGSRLVLQQKRPTFVVKIGETELALEAKIASGIFVRRCAQV